MALVFAVLVDISRQDLKTHNDKRVAQEIDQPDIPLMFANLTYRSAYGREVRNALRPKSYCSRSY